MANNQIRGVPEVPLGIDSQLRRHLTDMRQIVLALREAQSPPATPSNLKVTPEALGNLIQWTRAKNADYSEVLWNTTASLVGAIVVNVGSSAQWFDNIGQAAIKRFYWVRGKKNSGAQSLETAPIAGTTLAAGSTVNPPPPPPIAQQQRTDQRTGQNYPY